MILVSTSKPFQILGPAELKATTVLVRGSSRKNVPALYYIIRLFNIGQNADALQ